MSERSDGVLQKLNNILKDTASHQGAAYKAYGDSLEKMGKGDLGIVEVLKKGGDLYIREAVRTASSALELGGELVRFLLTSVGTKVLDIEKSVTAKPTAGKNK